MSNLDLVCRPAQVQLRLKPFMLNLRLVVVRVFHVLQGMPSVDHQECWAHLGDERHCTHWLPLAVDPNRADAGDSWSETS